MKLFAICYYAPPRLTPQAIQIGRLLYHLDAEVTMLHGDDPQFSKAYDQYPDFFERVAGLRVAGAGAHPGAAAHGVAPGFWRRLVHRFVHGFVQGSVPRILPRIARRLLPLYGAAPDAFGPWRRRALPVALAALDAARPDALASFGMPMSDHLLALDIKRRSGLPWLAHFSDPWVDNVFHPQSWLARQVNTALERQVIGHADAILFTSARTLDLVMAKYPATWRARAAVLPHAWDLGHFAGPPPAEPPPSPPSPPAQGAWGAGPGPALEPELEPTPTPEPTPAPEPEPEPDGATPGRPRQGRPRHIVRHIGACYGARSPQPLFAALARMQQQCPRHALSGRVAFEFFGHVSPGLLDTPAYRALAPGLVTFHGQVGYRESLALASGASALLLIDAPSASGSVFLPSKLVDYIGVGRPVWGITPPGTAADLIAEWAGGAPACAAPDDIDAVVRMLYAGLDALDAADAADAPDAGNAPRQQAGLAPGRSGPDAVAQRFAAPAVAAQLRQYLSKAIAVAGAGNGSMAGKAGKVVNGGQASSAAGKDGSAA